MPVAGALAAAGLQRPRASGLDRFLSRLVRRYGRWLIILPPLLFLVLFFLVPFAFAFKISFADTALHVPPYTSIWTLSEDHHITLRLSLSNYRYLLTDEVYAFSYLYSLRTAFFSTLICFRLSLRR